MQIKSNFISRNLLLASVLASLSSGAQAVGTADDTQHNVFISSFNNLDMNDDGKLDKAEASKEKLFFDNFAAADVDGNGSLDQAEYVEYRSQVEKKQLKRSLTDAEITGKIKAQLLKENGIKSLKIDVETYRRTVILSGFVDTQEQIERAEKIASSVEGVESVKNSLILKKN